MGIREAIFNLINSITFSDAQYLLSESFHEQFTVCNSINDAITRA